MIDMVITNSHVFTVKVVTTSKISTHFIVKVMLTKGLTKLMSKSIATKLRNINHYIINRLCQVLKQGL